MLEISELVTEVTTSGSKGAAGRRIEFSVVDSPQYDRSGIDVFKGCRFIYSWNGEELMRGLITDSSRGKDRKLVLAGHDNLIYLANNDDTFCYTNKTAKDIFIDICKRFEIEYGDVADTGYVIPSISIETGKLWDCILKALSATYKATGVRYYVESVKGKVSLFKRKEAVSKWVIEDGVNLLDYSYGKSISDIVTRVKILNDTNSVAAQVSNSDLEKRIGIFQAVETADSEQSKAQVKTVAINKLEIGSAGKETFSVSGLGITDVVAGKAVQIIISDLGISSGFYVDEDTHNFKGLSHTMNLTLTRTDELEFDEED